MPLFTRYRLDDVALRLTPAVAVAALLALPLSAGMRADAARQAQAPPCLIRGAAAAGQARLPGVGLTVTPKAGGTPASTSTGQDGSYSVVVPGPGAYTVVTDFTGFAPVTLDVTVDASCQAQQNITLTLASRVEAAKPAAPPAAEAAAAAARPADRRQAPAPFRGTVGAPAGTPGQPGAGAGQGQQPGQQAGVSVADESLDTVAAQLSLPPGFSVGTSGDSLATSGAAGQVNPMLFMMMGGDGPGGRGGEGMFGGTGVFGPDGQPGGIPGMGGEQGGFVAGGFPQGGGMGGPGGGGPGGGPGGGRGGGQGGGDMGGRGGGPGGGGMAGIAGRLGMAGGRGGANRIRVQASYNLAGSPFDAAPYPLTANTGEEPTYLNQRLTVNIGGPFKIPGIYNGKTGESFFLNYNGGFGGNLYEAYSIVPTAAWRAGDFSGSDVALIDPVTGLPFPNNQIPVSRIDPAALALLKYYPLPNQPGDAKNYYRSSTTGNRSDDINVRFTKSFGAAPGARGGAAGGAGARGGGGGRGGGRGGSNLSFGVQYRRTDADRNSAFPTTVGSAKGGSWNVPVNFTFNRWGMFNTLNVQYNRARSESTNLYAYQTDVAGEVGIVGVSTDPFSWGIPALSFTSVSGLRDLTPAIRTDQTLTVGMTQMKPYKRHAFRFGGDFRWMLNDSRTDSNPRGSFVFTGLYTGYYATPGASTRSTGTGLDFADFLLGMSQQATLNYGPGMIRFRSRAWSLFFQDDWRVNAKFTINAGVRYEYLTPYWEANNNLVNLDANGDFTAVTPVIAGGTGPYTGAFPTSAVDPDRNNIAPRTGVAWRVNNKTVVRGGYGITYSSPVYQSMAQRLSAQPPFATTDTRLGTVGGPLLLTTAFATPTPPSVTTNNFAVARQYALGWLQMWNVDLQRDLTRTVNVGMGYAGTRGASLDIQRAPNRGANGVAIADVQPFIWEESGGHSIMHALSLRLQKRPAKGVGAGFSYTLSKSRDNASTLGGGGGTVAQNDKDLEAEWGASSFDQRHRFSANVNIELPFGRNRRWLQTGLGDLILGGWQWTTNFTLASGTPYTARVTGAAANVAQGLNGTLRANYNGEAIQLDSPTMQQFFNTAVFSIPPTGTYGNSARNMIVGPGTQAANMSLQKILMLPNSRSITVRAQANNVFNNVQWGSIDSVVNSPTFGQVTSVRSMRSVTLSIRAGF